MGHNLLSNGRQLVLRNPLNPTQLGARCPQQARHERRPRQSNDGSDVAGTPPPRPEIVVLFVSSVEEHSGIHEFTHRGTLVCGSHHVKTKRRGDQLAVSSAIDLPGLA